MLQLNNILSDKLLQFLTIIILLMLLSFVFFWYVLLVLILTRGNPFNVRDICTRRRKTIC